MRQSQLILITRDEISNNSCVPLQDVQTEELWNIAKDISLHIFLREPALLELASRKEPGVLAYCDTLLNSEDQECWFSALRSLEKLNSYDAAQRLLVLCGSSSTGDRKIVLNALARILSSPQKENFRRLIRSFITPGELNISGWTPIALRVLQHVCIEKGIEIINSDGSVVDIDSYSAPIQRKVVSQSE